MLSPAASGKFEPAFPALTHPPTPPHQPKQPTYPTLTRCRGPGFSPAPSFALRFPHQSAASTFFFFLSFFGGGGGEGGGVKIKTCKVSREQDRKNI